MSDIYRKHCFLTCFVEKLNNNGNWEKITGFKSHYYNPESEHFSSEKYSNADEPFDDANNYILALLGNKSLCYINKITPIYEPKDLPYNVSYDVEDYYYDFFEENKEYGCSYLTAQEIMDYKHKDDEITLTKYVTPYDYKIFKETGEAKNYRDLPIGTYVQLVSNEYCDKYNNFDYMLTYTPITFKKTISELCSWLFNDVYTQLMERSENKTGNDVRIIFWMHDYYEDVERTLFL